jgi:hypothetical protein
MSDQPLTRKQMREQAEEIARKQREAANQVQEEVVKQVDIDDEGNPLAISERIKTRYAERVKKFGRGLLSFEEKKNN